jgi:hypothetical protein
LRSRTERAGGKRNAALSAVGWGAVQCEVKGGMGGFVVHCRPGGGETGGQGTSKELRCDGKF